MAPFFLHTDLVTRDSLKDYIEKHIFLLRPSEPVAGQENWPGCVGIELEMLPIRTDTKNPKTVKITGDAPNLQTSILDRIIEKSWSVQSEPTEGGHTQVSRVTMGKGDNLSFEPGGQLEISTLPYPCLSDAVLRINKVQKDIESALTEDGNRIGLVQVGMNPWQSVDEIGLQLPKKRYQAMNAHFKSIGPYGQRMMRQTCTVQVCLDFGRTEEQMSKRYIGSQLLSPFAAAIFAFSGISEKTPSIKGMRRKIWAHTDKTRTGLVLDNALLTKPSLQTLVSSYLDFALNAKVIFIANLDYEVPKDLTFSDWIEKGYKDTRPTFADLETHLSLLFPEVRPRGFLEIRSVDCQAKPWQFVPAAFYTGILYDDENLNWLFDKYGNQLEKIQSFMEEAEQGLDHSELAAACKEIMDKAVQGFDRLPDCFRGEGTELSLLAFKEHFTDRGRCPSDDMIDLASSGLSWNSFIELNKSWEKLASPSTH